MSRDNFGRVIGRTRGQTVFESIVFAVLLPLILVSLILYPPARRVGTKGSLV